MKGSIMKKEIVVSGIRATGKLHLGNFLGAMRNFTELQENYDCYFFVADYHSLTTETNPEKLRANLMEIVMDYLAIGLNPAKCTIFTQSSVLEIAELSLLLSMVQPAGDLERLPTYQEKKKSQEKNINAGLLFYPVLMAADILIQKATLVPVGKDQLPHIRFTRELAKRFNRRYENTFPMPEALESKAVRVPGLDGTEKMGKTAGNTINLDDSPEQIERKIAVAVTDVARKKREDPGNPLICNLFAIHELISSSDTIECVRKKCPKAGIGCIECKKILSNGIIEILKPIQQRRLEIVSNPDHVIAVLHKGGIKARESAKKTVDEVREKMGLKKF